MGTKRMDENTRRINGMFPDELFFWLEGVAKRNGWTFSRALRWAVREAMKREAKTTTASSSRDKDLQALL